MPDEKNWWVVRKRGAGSKLCTTHDGGLLQPDFHRCKGPYATEAEASTWINDNCDDAMMCEESKCGSSS